MSLSIEWQLLLLLLIANGVPVMIAAICKDRGAHPLDGGRVLADGYRVLGDSKTWRGVVVAPLMTALAAVMLSLPVGVGVIIGVGAMLGDLLSSFLKRRLNMASSSRALGLDQIPEALLPLLLVAEGLALNWSVIGQLVVGFIALQWGLSLLLFWFGIRKEPY